MPHSGSTSFGDRAGGREAFSLAVGLPLGVSAGGSAIIKDVDVILTRGGATVESGTIGIRWAPRAGGLAEETLAALHLEGRYTAPGGTLGGLFDLVAGRRIALATLHRLLENVRAAAKADYRVRIGMAIEKRRGPDCSGPLPR